MQRFHLDSPKEQELRPERMQLLFFILSYFNTAPRFALVTKRA